MSTPIRKKRNFKSLQLAAGPPPAAPPPAPPASEPEIIAPTPPPPAAMLIPTRPAPVPAPAAPAGGKKKRPPPMTLKAPKIPQANTAVEQQDPTLLTVNAGASGSAPSPAADGRASSRRSTYATLSNTLANLDLNSETKLDLRDEDLEELQDLGQGNGGSVKKVRHIPTGVVMAKKIVLIDAKPAVRKQILRELQIMYNCHSEYIISFHGAYISDPNICICMEFGDKGSFDGIYKKIGAIDIDVVAIVAMSVLEGLIYLYDVHRIIHRDIKPSNILCNGKGQVKICDFGVSGELINSIADTFVGTSTYMSPERIQGAQYTVKSDVWSLGISLIELALGRFPFADSESDDSDLSDLEHTLSPGRPISMSVKRQAKEDKKKKDRRKSKGVSLQGGGMTMSILELLQHIVNEPAPRLTPEDRYPVESNDFIEACLYKDPEVRKAPKELVAHPWIQQTLEARPDMETWASTF